MKVLHVYRMYHPDPPGGMHETVRQLCLSMQPLGVENHVFALSVAPEPAVLQRPEARVVRSRSWWAPASCDLGGPTAFKRFREAVQAVDLVHYLHPWPFADVLRLAAPAKPSVLTYISDIVRQRWLGKLYAPLMQHNLRSMQAIVYNAPAYREGSPVLSAPTLQPRLHQIPLGMLESALSPVGDPTILSRHGLDDGQPFLLFLGALRYYKGLQYLLAAAASTRGRIVLAGDGGFADEWRARAQAAGLNNLIFTGHVSEAEKLSLLQHCRAMVLPSHLRSEAYGQVLIEASMQSRPLITCEIGTGTSYINQHGQTGLVVPPADAPALAQAMNDLLGDAELAARYGRAARTRFEQVFAGEHMGRAYHALFAQVLGQATQA